MEKNKSKQPAKRKDEEDLQTKKKTGVVSAAATVDGKARKQAATKSQSVPSTVKAAASLPTAADATNTASKTKKEDNAPTGDVPTKTKTTTTTTKKKNKNKNKNKSKSNRF